MSIPHELVESFAKGHGVIIVGPELSIDAGLPSSDELAERLATTLDSSPPPQGADSQQLSYEQIAQNVELEYGRDQLVAYLREELENLYLEPTPVHQLLVRLLVKQIFTTNIDRVLENTLQEKDREWDLILSQSNSKAIGSHHEQRLQLVKLYGDLDCPDSLVTTSDDHDLYPINHPDLMRLLTLAWRTCSLLFVGYSNNDPNLRRLLTHLRLQSGELAHQAFIILFNSGKPQAASERVVQEYERKGLCVINLEVESSGSPFEDTTHLHNPMLADCLELFHAQVQAEAEQQREQLARRRPALPAEPYKFLDSFTRKDSAIFYGREVESETLYRQIVSSRLSVLYGESGVGKTSLLQAAVLPRLKRDGYTVVYARPLSDPLQEVREALVTIVGKGSNKVENSSLRALIESQLAPASQGSIPTELGGARRQPLLIVLDQFEEFFQPISFSRGTQTVIDDGLDHSHERFISELIEAIGTPQRQVHCLLVLRSDYLDKLDELGQDLGHDPLSSRMRLRHLGSAEARAAIAEPSAAFEISIETALLDQLLSDLQQVNLSPTQNRGWAKIGIAPTQLQIVCTELWREWERSRSDYGMTLNHYYGARQILQNYLDHVIKNLKQFQVREEFVLTLDSDAAQEAARKLLKGMIRVDQASRSSVRTQLQINRRQVSHREIEAQLDIDPADVKGLLAYLSQRRVIRRLPGSKRFYELTHEVIIPKVWEWVGQAERHLLNLQHILQQATVDYVEYGLLLPLAQLRLITEQGSHLSLNQHALTLLLISAIDHHQDAGVWVSQMDSDHAIKELADLLAGSKRTQYTQIANALGQTHSTKAIPYLQELLQDKDNQVQRQVVDALVSLNVPEVVHTLYYAARGEQQLPRTVPLIEGLEKLEHDEAAQMLSLLASDHANPHARSRAANALLYLGYPQGIRLIAQLANSDNPRIRQDSVQAAKRTWRENPGEFESMLNHYDPRIQTDAITVLAMVEELDTCNLLFQAVQSGSQSVRREAIKALQPLQQSNGPLPFEPLLSLLPNEDVEVREAGVTMLGQSGDARAYAPLVAQLRDEAFTIRLSVTRALGTLYNLPVVVQLGSQEAEARQEAAGLLHDDYHLQPALENNSVHAPRSSVGMELREAEQRILGLRFDLLSTALLDKVAEVRRAVTTALGELADVRAVDALVTALQDKAPQVRLAAARALEESARQASVSTRAVEALLTALADDDLQVRVAVARALGEVEDPRAIETLVAALEDEAPEVRMVVASILEQSPEMMQLPEVHAVDPLLAALSDKAPQVRMAAADALAQSGDQRAIEPLSTLLQDEDFLVRLSAISALGTLYPLPALVKLGSEEPQKRRVAARELAQLGDSRAASALLAALGDDSPLVTIAVIEALGDLADTLAVGPLLTILPNGTPQERIAVITALGQLADKQAVEPIIATLNDEQAKVRRRAAVVLGQLQDWRAVEPLMTTLNDNDPQMRMAVANALGQLPDTRALQPLVNSLQDSIPRVRIAAVNALAQLNDTRAVDALLKSLEDDEFLVRLAAIRALGVLWKMPLLWKLGSTRNAKERGQAASTLGSIAESRALEPLIATLWDKSPKVRIEAARALGQLKDARAIESLRAAKDDKNSRVRMEIARALRQLRRSRKVEPLKEDSSSKKGKRSRKESKERRAPQVDIQPELNRLGSSNAKIRRIAATTLGQLGVDQAVEPLITALSDEAPDVRRAVVRALERLNNSQAVEPLVGILVDDDFLVRLTAISALGVLWERLVLVQLGSESVEERLQGINTIKTQLQRLAQAKSQTESQVSESVSTDENTALQLIKPLIVTLQDQVGNVQIAAARALAESAPYVPQLYQQVVDSLLSALSSARQREADTLALADEMPEVCVALIIALGESKDKRVADPLKDALQDDNLSIRLAATRALGSLWEVPLLARLGHEQAQVRQEAAIYLTRDLQPSAIIYRTCIRSVEPLLTALRDEVPAVRGEAANALYSLGSKKITRDEVMAPLLTGLEYKDPSVRRHVARILAQLRNRRAITPLTTALQDEDAQVREQAAIALRQLGHVDVIYSTLSALRSQDVVVRQRAASVLGQLRDKKAVDPLIVALQDSDPLVRQESARSLAQLRDRRAIAPLSNIMRDDIFPVRLAAMRALGALWNLPPLAQLGSESAEARQQAAESWPNSMQPYIKSGDTRAIEPLITILSDESPQVRSAVATTLGRIKDKRAVNPLVKALHDDVPEVQNAVANALKELEDVRDIEQMVKRAGMPVAQAQPKPRFVPRYRNEEHLKQRSTLRALGVLWNQPILAQLGSENMPIRLKAANILAQTGDMEAVKPLIMALSDEAVEVRRACATALGRLSDQRAVEPLIAALQENDLQLTIAASTALGQLGSPVAVMPLLPLLQNNNAEVRIACATALQQLNDKRAVDALTTALQDQELAVQQAVTKALASLHELPRLAELTSQNPQVRQQAAHLIAESGDARALEPLVIALKAQNETPQVRIALIDALVKLNDSRAINPLVEQVQQIRRQGSGDTLEVQYTLIRALGVLYPLPQLVELGDSDIEVRLFAASALGQSRDRRVVEPLLACLQDDPMRLVATRALGNLSGLNDLVQLGDQNSQMRQKAANTLGQLGDKRAIQPLIAALNDQEPGVRRQVASALGNMKDPRVVVPLLNALRDSNSKVRGQAANALRLVADQALEPLLHALAHDENVGVRKHLARILGHMENEQTIVPLIGALQDDDAEVRKNSAISLRQLGDERAIKASLQALRHEHPQTRLRAAGALGQLRDDRAVKPLISALHDDHALVRQEAARALGQLRNQRAVNPLIGALSDIDAEVRRRAINALKLLGDTRAIQPLRRAQNDSNRLVQEAANEALRVLEVS